ncbi:MAG: hypothetical protein Q8N63_02190 [Nanoarchaeota archaeon]|nr:hypothetical protein [Nanoarchaeota archaeon]
MSDNKNSIGLGIAGFILGLLSILLFLSIGVILAIIGLILCVIQIKRNKTKLAIAGLILSIIGIIVGIIMIVYVALFTLSWQEAINTLNKEKAETNPAIPCLTINLQVDELSPNLDTIKISRGVGKGDLDKIKVFLNGNPIKDLSASDMDESTYKEFSLVINSGDKVEIAPILKDGTICAIIDTKIA